MHTKSKLILLTTLVMLALAPILLCAHHTLPGDLAKNETRFSVTPPPSGPVRPIAEFEPASHVLICYPLGIPLSLVVQLSNTAQVICLVSSNSAQNSATNAFNNAGVNMANLSFLVTPTDSYWTRDYSPWFIFDGDGQFGAVDFRYNRPRPNDNNVGQILANHLDMPYYGMNITQTGGNFMTDGINTAAQTTIAYTENSSLGQNQVNESMLNYMGITNYHVVPDPNNTYIDHIDCWGKFLAPDKILIRSVPSSHAQYNAIEQTAAYFASQNCAWGYPYKVYRVNTPQNQPYSNSLILNKRVFVPTMNNSTHDNAALQVYRDAMPGYEVIGIPSGSEPWQSTDALHCRTHEIPDRQMLHISHQPMHGEYGHSAWWPFSATVTAHSGQPVYADSVFIRYKVNQGNWQTQILEHMWDNEYGATLTGFSPGDTIRYYIHAADQSGRSADQPIFAELDPHIFSYAADTEPPTIIHNPPTSIASGQHWFSATITDNIGISTVFLHYRTDEGETHSIPMMSNPEAPPDYWWVEIDLEFKPGDQYFYYQIEAWDNASPHNVAYYPFPGEWINVPIEPVSIYDDIIPEVQTSSLHVFPNPFVNGLSDYLTIEYRGNVKKGLLLNIFNNKGQLVYQENCPGSQANGVRFVWNRINSKREKVPNGVYFLRVSDGDNALTSKVLILN
ncbi:MAG: agmatine deiminase family protein [Candidatus Cloacimonadaceae bacterium]|jgi:agmatine/peptidylarginine deiminase|nr:agmatine deiminase family protein [Candidatus Cloacimonadota bacterium]MDX9950139.1 agmatine deiminase family protein [Candidatus Syntrophosphaera sp.]